jgi:hypothetical protein
MRLFCTVLVLGLAFELTTAQVCNHPPARAWIAVSDTSLGRDTIWFGHSPDATYGLDPHLCEYEIAPLPGILDVRFVNIPGREGWDTPQGLGMGFPYDYRSFWSEGQADTHKVRFYSYDMPVTFRWSPLQIAGICDSALLYDELGGWFFFKRMHVDSILVVENPALFTFLIRKIGAHTTGAVRQRKPSELLDAPSLCQNYPNPFNPTTVINYELKEKSKVRLGVYDLLGREVAMLAEGIQDAGLKSVVWDARLRPGVPSGVYFYRLSIVPQERHGQREDYSQTRKLVLLR